jgi:alcohol dehydrogenase, propanol-preferring
MRAMLLQTLGPVRDDRTALVRADWPDPVPAAGEVLVRVSTCGVCHTELDEIEGRTPPPTLPVIPGHQVVGRVEAMGEGSHLFRVDERVGIAWISSACGHCEFCRRGEENLCDQFQATGRDVHGGYAELIAVPESFAHAIPDSFSDAEAAPLLCAGAIGYRSVSLTGLKDGQSLGLTGFGASGHLVLKLVQNRFPNTRVYVFARSQEERVFALELGASWAGDTAERAPEKLHAIIDTTPAWTPIVLALENLERGGRLVVNAIRKEDTDKEVLLGLDYSRHLWLEKEIKSVANVTRHDVREFLRLADEMRLKPEIQEYALDEANRALFELKTKKVRGAKVLTLA